MGSWTSTGVTGGQDRRTQRACENSPAYAVHCMSKKRDLPFTSLLPPPIFSILIYFLHTFIIAYIPFFKHLNGRRWKIVVGDETGPHTHSVCTHAHVTTGRGQLLPSPILSYDHFGTVEWRVEPFHHSPPPTIPPSLFLTLPLRMLFFSLVEVTGSHLLPGIQPGILTINHVNTYMPAFPFLPSSLKTNWRIQWRFHEKRKEKCVSVVVLDSFSSLPCHIPCSLLYARFVLHSLRKRGKPPSEEKEKRRAHAFSIIPYC